MLNPAAAGTPLPREVASGPAVAPAVASLTAAGSAAPTGGVLAAIAHMLEGQRAAQERALAHAPIGRSVAADVHRAGGAGCWCGRSPGAGAQRRAARAAAWGAAADKGPARGCGQSSPHWLSTCPTPALRRSPWQPGQPGVRPQGAHCDHPRDMLHDALANAAAAHQPGAQGTAGGPGACGEVWSSLGARRVAWRRGYRLGGGLPGGGGVRATGRGGRGVAAAAGTGSCRRALRYGHRLG